MTASISKRKDLGTIPASHWQVAPPELWGRFCYSIDDSDMHKLNLIKFYRYGVGLASLWRIASGARLINEWRNLSDASGWLHNFLAETEMVPIPKTREAAQSLYEVVDSILAPFLKGMSDELTVQSGDHFRLNISLGHFESEFEHESREINIFSVPDRCAYSTTILISNGENLLLESVRDVVTDYDRGEIHEAGKCLAFDLPTAAAFHMVRAVESVLRGYYDVVTNGAERLKRKNGKDESMGPYINALEKEKVGDKITSVLWDVKRLHRDPVTHPQDVLDMEQAVALLGVVVSAITAMTRDIQKRGTSCLPFVAGATTKNDES